MKSAVLVEVRESGVSGPKAGVFSVGTASLMSA